MFTSELTPLARALSELLSCEFDYVADQMSQLTDEELDAFDYLDCVPADCADFIRSIVRDMVACGELDTSKQEDWACVDPDVLFPYVYDYLSDVVCSFAEQYDVAINYLACRDLAEPDVHFGHAVYEAGCNLIDCLMDAGDITAAAFCDAWYYGNTSRMIELLGLDEDLFERARALQYCSLDGYTFADIEAELVR